MRKFTRYPTPFTECSYFGDFYTPMGLPPYNSVTHLLMYLVVTTPTKAHQVALVMRTAFGQRHDVVYFFYRCEPSVSKALLAQRMRLDIATAYSLPRSAVAFADVIAPFVLVVSLCH